MAITVVNFEDLNLQSESFVREPQGDGFVSQGAFFNNSFERVEGGIYDNAPVWYGWSYSNITDNTVQPPLDFELGAEFPIPNEFSAAPGGGANGSSNYGIAYGFTPPGDQVIIDLPAGTQPLSARISNTAFTATVIENGNNFANPFTDDDFFKVTIKGIDDSEQVIGSVEFLIAENGEIVNEWEFVDLTRLAGASQLSFTLDSSDLNENPEFGFNTPAYFALDDLVLSSTLTTEQGSAENDTLVGGDEGDRLISGAGSDFLYGKNGDDVLEGNTGFDFLFGGDGNDFLNGGIGRVRVSVAEQIASTEVREMIP
jgi:Ca2+-binding RTX toxin-like protein